MNILYIKRKRYSITNTFFEILKFYQLILILDNRILQKKVHSLRTSYNISKDLLKTTLITLRFFEFEYSSSSFLYLKSPIIRI